MGSVKGLSTTEARELLNEVGRNELMRTGGVRPLKILLSQFSSPLMIILIVAALISVAIGFLPGKEPNVVDAALILIIVLLSGIFGFIQDYQAEKTIEALKKMAAPNARVIRDGKETEISSAEVVPGDVLLLESGDMVVADCELAESFHLEVDESVLTGESIAVRKEVGESIYSNTYVTGGNAVALVQKTAMDTRIGKVASRLQELEDEKSSFQKELGTLGKRISILTLIVGAIIAVVGIFKFGFYNSLLMAISLAVAAIPEGLPAVVVLALAVGANVMVKRNALIRKLAVVESVGAVNVICTDKTGTLTKNEMTVVKLFYDDVEGDFTESGWKLPLAETGKMLLKCGALCNNSTRQEDEEAPEGVKYFGEQTEIALRKASEKVLSPDEMRGYKKVNEISFSSQRKMMSVIMEGKEGELCVFSKGAPEVLLHRCNRLLLNGEVQTLTSQKRDFLLQHNEHFARAALRVLGFAYKPTDDITDGTEEDLIWIGLQGMIDPPRAEVAQSLKECRTAGIRVIMITGDNPLTAGAIANQIGLESSGTVEGSRLDSMTEEELKTSLDNQVNVFARTTPFHKLRILEALGEKNNVAMTGDGVNDALAIKRASVGISMGLKGTEVAKQASDIVLLDDNFSTIKEAVKEGRTIFNNIRKFINYLLTCNFAEVMVIFLASIFLSITEPILFPVQILWINLLTDGLVALALGVDPPAKDIMDKKPRGKDEPIINRQLMWLIGAIGIKKTIILLLTFTIVYHMEGLEAGRSALFAGFVLYEFVRIASIRYMEKLNWWSNKWLIIALFGSLILQMIVIYSPLGSLFSVSPLGLFEWGVLLGGSLIGFVLAIGITRVVVNRVEE